MEKKTKFEICVTNDVGCVISNEIIEEVSENEALMTFLKKHLIFNGDTITIEEV